MRLFSSIRMYARVSVSCATSIPVEVEVKLEEHVGEECLCHAGECAHVFVVAARVGRHVRAKGFVEGLAELLVVACLVEVVDHRLEVGRQAVAEDRLDMDPDSTEVHPCREHFREPHLAVDKEPVLLLAQVCLESLVRRLCILVLLVGLLLVVADDKLELGAHLLLELVLAYLEDHDTVEGELVVTCNLDGAPGHGSSDWCRVAPLGEGHEVGVLRSPLVAGLERHHHEQRRERL
mmetsp:Transcript_56325/g.78059  ORF Transcript_56325/g.78059 Transcript_56325/m.78059 type:complete len:235 (+) Transcript_56325:15-719(+)